MSEGAGFRCTSCSTIHSKHFMYRSSDSGEPICVKCYDFCVYCDRPFSEKGMNKCKESNDMYCKSHSTACQKCGSFVGLDQAKFSGETQGAFCSCIDSKQCKVCEDYYSDQYLSEGKCQACRNLKLLIADNQEITQIRKNKEYERVTDWMVGVNKFNKVIIAKGTPVDSIFVARPNMIKVVKKARLSDL